MTQGLLAGRTIGGRYELLDLVGVGGMGEVYRARDRELDEVLAIKVIREDLVALPGVIEQFRSEVKLARRVTHRNVARTYELGRADGITYYTMELVDGVPLTRRIHARNGRPLAIEEVAEIGIALCDALDAAHHAGVIHRDLKPDNVLVTQEQRVVLADFGLAAAVRAGGGTSGTPRYMAPEQALGEPPTPATDLYALGVILYELVTGMPAFTGNVAAIITAKQETDHLVLEGVDARFAALVAKATRRDARERPKSALAMRRDLLPFVRPREEAERTEMSAVSALALPTVFVRPFIAAPNAPGHLVDGYHQAVLARLGEWPRLRVSPHGVFGPGVVDARIEATAETLTVRATVGTATLALTEPCEIDALGGGVERTARVLAALAGTTSAAPPIRTRPLSPDALDLITHARHFARANRNRIGEAVALCHRALELAPGHALVLAVLAMCEVMQTFYDRRAPAWLLDSAADHALAALAADHELAEAHFARGHVELHRGRAVIAAACFRTAIARAPLFAEAHEWLGRQLLEAGFLVDAMARVEEAKALSPYFGNTHTEVARAYLLNGELEAADREIAKLGDIIPDGGLAFWLRWQIWRGNAAAEHELWQRVKKFLGDGGGTAMTPAFVFAAFDPDRSWSERRDELLAEEQALTGPSARWRGFLAQLVAESASRAGDVETAIAAVRRSVDNGLFDQPWIDACPLLVAVRAHPAFAALAAEVAQRAEAIHDALYGDHRQLAHADTSITL